MRRDAYVQNDSGWFSALSGHVVDDIRNLVIVGHWVFRVRFADVWPMDHDDDDWDGESGDDE